MIATLPSSSPAISRLPKFLIYGSIFWSGSDAWQGGSGGRQPRHEVSQARGRRPVEELQVRRQHRRAPALGEREVGGVVGREAVVGRQPEGRAGQALRRRRFGQEA